MVHSTTQQILEETGGLDGKINSLFNTRKQVMTRKHKKKQKTILLFVHQEDIEDKSVWRQTLSLSTPMERLVEDGICQLDGSSESTNRHWLRCRVHCGVGVLMKRFRELFSVSSSNNVCVVLIFFSVSLSSMISLPSGLCIHMKEMKIRCHIHFRYKKSINSEEAVRQLVQIQERYDFQQMDLQFDEEVLLKIYCETQQSGGDNLRRLNIFLKRSSDKVDSYQKNIFVDDNPKVWEQQLSHLKVSKMGPPKLIRYSTSTCKEILSRASQCGWDTIEWTSLRYSIIVSKEYQQLEDILHSSTRLTDLGHLNCTEMTHIRETPLYMDRMRALTKTLNTNFTKNARVSLNKISRL